MADRRLDYINGITIYTYKKIARFAFGEDHVLKLKKNVTTFTYDVFLVKNFEGEEISEESINWFIEFWGNRLPIFLDGIQVYRTDLDDN